MRADTLKRALGLSLLALLAFLLQASFFSRLRILGVAPLLLPLLAVGCGLLAGAGWGGGLGLVCGILCDSSMGAGSLTFTVWLTAAGFLAGTLGELVLHRRFGSFLLLAALCLLAGAALQMLPLLYGSTPVLPLVGTALLQTLYSLLFALPCYGSLRLVLRPRGPRTAGKDTLP